MTSEALDNAAEHRFEINVDGHVGFLDYHRSADTLTILHTEVPVEIRGRHIGDQLVDAAIASARAAGLRLIVVCPFARAYLLRQRRSTRASDAQSE